MMTPGIALAAAFDTALAWARWQKRLHPVAALRAFLRERVAPARSGDGTDVAA